MADQRRRTLAGQLLTWYAVTVLVLLVVLGVALNRVLEAQVLDDLTGSLESQALLLRATLTDEPDVQTAVLAWARNEDLRVTVISTDGTVLADSSRDPVGMENHADRPEVQVAREGATGVASRASASVGVEFRYVAVAPNPDGWIVRVAEPVSVIAERLQRLRIAILGAAVGAALVGVGAVWLVARRIVRPIQKVTDSAERIAGGDQAAQLGGGRTVEMQTMADTLNHMAAELRRRAQQSEEERLVRDRVLESLQEGVILVGGDDTVDYSNTWARTALGETQSLRLPGALQSLVALARAGTSTVHRDFDYGVPSRQFTASAVLLDEAQSVLLVLADVTEVLRVEAMRRDFVADASHELKTPISAIRAGSETVVHAIDDDPEAAKKFAGQVHVNAVRLGRIVVDLLDLSRLETEEPVFERVRLDELVKDEVVRIDSPTGTAPIELILETEPVELLGSREDLRLATRNLLDNAQHYGAGGEVRVVVRKIDEEVVLEVIDHGVGIPSRDLPRVFERFYRVDVARSRHTGGTGLGLAIVKHVAGRHGGRVEAESELGVGSTFRMVLPLAGVSSRDG